MTPSEQDWLEAHRIVEQWKAEIAGQPLGRGIRQEAYDLDWVGSRQSFEWGE